MDQGQVQHQAALQRETPAETESRRVTNAARQQASQLHMTMEETCIRRSATAN